MEVKSSGDQSSFSVFGTGENDWIIRVTADTAKSQTFSIAELWAAPLIICRWIRRSPASRSLRVHLRLRDSGGVPSVNLSRPLCCSRARKLVWSCRLFAQSIVPDRNTPSQGVTLAVWAWLGDLRAIWLLTAPKWCFWIDITQYGAGEWKLGLLNGQQEITLAGVRGREMEGLEAAIGPDGPMWRQVQQTGLWDCWMGLPVSWSGSRILALMVK